MVDLVSEPSASTALALINPIVLENQKTGNPQSEWDLANGLGSSNIEGFSTDISVNLGQRVDFKINTDSTNYRVDIYRLGYYGGLGARKVASFAHQAAAIDQPDALVNTTTGLIDAGNWSVTDSWTVPGDATSGIYIAKLVRLDGIAGENHIPFIVRNDARPSDIVFQTSDTTWQAYNSWGGANLYNGPTGAAVAVSYNRPFVTRNGDLQSGPQDFIFGVEYPALRWLEQNGYDVSYITGVDVARDPQILLDHKVFLSVGHDEYWSAEQRNNVEAAREAGVNLQFWSGNEVYWKTRWETSIDGSGTAFRTLVTYKETKANAQIDPTGIWTGTWRDPRFSPPADGGNPENALTGTMFQVDSYRLDTINIPFDMTRLRFWRDTSVAATAEGQSATLAGTYLGYEWDISPDNGFAPEGLIKLSSSTYEVDTLLLDFGSKVGPGTATHNLTLYRDQSSGALVFGAGTVYWAWALDANHDLEATPIDPAVQQAMVNLFADMGVLPDTLQASLVMAVASSDFTAPLSSVNAAIHSTAFNAGEVIALSGLASDVGGRVAAVEVSVDGGTTWRQAKTQTTATGTTWSYQWTGATLPGTYTVVSRATDDSLNTGLASAGVTVTVNPGSSISLFSASATPSTFANDANPVELGMKFRTSTVGVVSAVRFYKGALDGGVHQGHLWSSTGTLLGSVTFTGETASGWQTAEFANPIALDINTTYVVSYHSNGNYGITPNEFAFAKTNGALTGLASASSGGNGVYAYGASGQFPTASYNASGYFVDVVFSATSVANNSVPNAVNDANFLVTQNTTLAIPASALLANDNDPDGDLLSIYTVSNPSGGSVRYNDITKSVIFAPTVGYSGAGGFSYTITDGRGGLATASVSLAVTPNGVTTTLFSNTVKPTIVTVADPNAVELGMKFQSNTEGVISGIRFYKGPDNVGNHEAHLWTTSGTLLATASFTNETATGWQTALLADSIAVTANTTYVVSYHSNGFYSVTPNGFASAISNSVLSAPAASDGGNGVYSYGTSGTFPTSSYNASNYLVDVVFTSAGSGTNLPPIAVNDTGLVTSQNTPVIIGAATLLANDSDPNGNPLTLLSVSNAVRGTVAYAGETGNITFTPDTNYVGAASFSYTIGDGTGLNATATASIQIGAVVPSVSLFSPSSTPERFTSDPNGVELGMKFTTSQNGNVTSLKYYKSALDTGPHEGHLWSSTGTLLATATFTNESASGWQTQTLVQPVTLSAGASYVVSYHSNGFYGVTPNGFGSAITSGPLTAPSSATSGGNGVYAYGSSGLFPTNTYNASNYWVDVGFTPQLAA